MWYTCINKMQCDIWYIISFFKIVIWFECFIVFYKYNINVFVNPLNVNIFGLVRCFDVYVLSMSVLYPMFWWSLCQCLNMVAYSFSGSSQWRRWCNSTFGSKDFERTEQNSSRCCWIHSRTRRSHWTSNEVIRY